MVFSIKSLGTVANSTPSLHLDDLLMSIMSQPIDEAFAIADLYAPS